MKRNSLAKSELQFLAVTTALVLLLGVPVLYSLASESHENQIMVKKTSDLERSPASQNEFGFSNHRLQEGANKTSLLSFSCEANAKPREVSSSFVRIAGAPCPGTHEMQILNATNGFSASVIFSKGHKFTTDFIDLREGENVLQISSTQSDGSKTSQILHITRRSPANNSQ